MIVFNVLREKLKKKLNEPSYQHSGEDYYVGICSAEEIVYEVEREFLKDNPIYKYAMLHAEHLVKHGVDISEKWETATQNAAALEEAYLRGRQDERDRFARWQEESNNGWIPCSERLPSAEYNNVDDSTMNIPVLVQYKDYSVTHEVLTYNTYTKMFTNGHTDFTKEIIAWQPLPELYKKNNLGEKINVKKN